MLLTFAPMNIFAAESDKTAFSDMKTTDYYAQAATALEQLGIISGYPDGTYGAEKSITRAEMAAIVCRIIDKEADAEEAKGETIFDDVASDHWASGYINIAVKEGIINGDGNGKFRPEDEVTYEEAIKMIVCALGYADNIGVDPSDWSKAYLDIANKKGITSDLKGKKGEPATRGDIAVMSYNGLDTESENSKIPATPISSVKAGEYKGTQKVKLTTVTKDSDIYYTIDGTTPTAKSTKYTKEISISKTSTLKAIAVKNGVVSKGVMSVDYTIKKISSGGGGGGSSSSTTKYTVSFDLNYEGATGAPANQSIRSGNKATEPTAPERDGYSFVGWCTDEECGTQFDFDTNINSTTTLYAKWEKLIDKMNLYSSKSSVLIGKGEKAYIYLETEIETDFINLYNAEDDTEAVISLYDDGDFLNHGDDMAGDGIYSAYISDLSDNDIEITFVAIYNNSKSNEVKVQYYTVISDEENEIMATVDNKIDEILLSGNFTEKTIEEKEELVQDTLNAFVETGEISDGSIAYNENDQLFSFQYSNGVLGGVMIGEFDKEQNSYTSRERMPNNDIETFNLLSESEDMNVSLNSDEDFLLGYALILNSFPSFETEPADIAYRTNFYNDTRNDWNSKGLKTTIDTDVTVSDYQNFDDYEVICISTHGSTYSWNDGFLWLNKHTVPAICLSEKQTKEKNKQYSGLLKNKEIAKVNGCYWILPAFFENEYGSGTLEDTFIFSECCMAMGTGQGSTISNYNYTMANAFINSSAKAYVGFHNSVFADYSRKFMKNYIDKLIEGENSISSYNSSISVYGSNHEIWYNNNSSYTLKDYYEIYKDKPETFVPSIHIAYPVHNGNTGATLIETGLKNGAFEDYNISTTHPKYWNKVGDVRTLTQLGDVKPLSGNGRMAVISTGIGANSTNVIGNGTEGSIMSQTFKLPNNTTKITFDYNLISEEPMEFVGSQYDDAFAVNVICENTNVYNKIYESINSSTWAEVSGIDFSGGDETVYQTNWKSAEIDVSAYAGKVITLRFIIYDVGDSAYDSACVIDNVSIKYE